MLRTRGKSMIESLFGESWRLELAKKACGREIRDGELEIKDRINGLLGCRVVLLFRRSISCLNGICTKAAYVL